VFIGVNRAISAPGNIIGFDSPFRQTIIIEIKLVLNGSLSQDFGKMRVMNPQNPMAENRTWQDVLQLPSFWLPTISCCQSAINRMVELNIK
jgi:hypothetical protein